MERLWGGGTTFHRARQRAARRPRLGAALDVSLSIEDRGRDRVDEQI